MLSLPPSVRVFVATQPVDGRKGPDSLMSIVRDVFGEDPLGGHLFVFFSKRCDRVRIVYWDRNGFAMWTKRLEGGLELTRFGGRFCYAVRFVTEWSNSNSMGLL
jgi:transposase